jgi:predicted DNA-binding protein (UPF0251 family)
MRRGAWRVSRCRTWWQTRSWRHGDVTASCVASHCRGCWGSPDANHRRSGARQAALRERLQTEPLTSEQAPAAQAQVNDRDPRVAAALAGLAERDREALMLVAWDGLEHRVAATVMGCSTGAFTVRVHRARRKLERALAVAESSPIEVTQEARSLQ